MSSELKSRRKSRVFFVVNQRMVVSTVFLFCSCWPSSIVVGRASKLNAELRVQARSPALILCAASLGRMRDHRRFLFYIPTRAQSKPAIRYGRHLKKSKRNRARVSFERCCLTADQETRLTSHPRFKRTLHSPAAILTAFDSSIVHTSLICHGRVTSLKAEAPAR